MTICLAAVCNFGHDKPPFVVGAADRMITIGDIEYEPDQTKILALATHTVILLAGEMRLHAVACVNLLRKLRAGGIPGLLVRDIAEAYADEFAQFRRYHAEREILTPLGLTLRQFTNNQAGMSRDFILETAAKLQKYQIDAPAIITGIDQHGTHLYKVLDPGAVMDCGTECFAATGIGEWHAESQFMVAGFEKQWPVSDAITLALTAKRRAETNAGIGKTTDMFIIGRGGAQQLLPNDVQILDEILEKRENRAQKSEAMARKEVGENIKDLVSSLSISKVQQPTAQTKSPEKAD